MQKSSIFDAKSNVQCLQAPQSNEWNYNNISNQIIERCECTAFRLVTIWNWVVARNVDIGKIFFFARVKEIEWEFNIENSGSECVVNCLNNYLFAFIKYVGWLNIWQFKTIALHSLCLYSLFASTVLDWFTFCSLPFHLSVKLTFGELNPYQMDDEMMVLVMVMVCVFSSRIFVKLEQINHAIWKHAKNACWKFACRFVFMQHEHPPYL